MATGMHGSEPAEDIVVDALRSTRLLYCIETLVHVMIADMEEMDGLFDSSDDGSDPSDDGKEQSQFSALNADVLRQIAMSLKPADVYSLSLTCKHFEENGKLMLGTLMNLIA